ncbi:MAG: hypothetical protein PUC88_01475 [Clostridia bacterium]|nr:hypothetical protein [Clostridia bacterium]
MARERKKYDDDDGRVIANMDIEGMPWNNGYNRWFGGIYKKKYRRDIEKQMAEQQQVEPQDLKLTKRETRMLVLNALAAVLLIGAVFALAGFLFILFCTKVWFR